MYFWLRNHEKNTKRTGKDLKKEIFNISTMSTILRSNLLRRRRKKNTKINYKRRLKKM